MQRAQIVFAFAAGETYTAVANRFGIRGSTVGKWRHYCLALGSEGLHDDLRPCRPRRSEVDTVAEVNNRALQTKAAADSDHQVIVAVGVSNQLPDVERLEPKPERIVAITGALPAVMILDAGYWSEDNANCCADQGIDACIATGRLSHGQPPVPKRGPWPRDADAMTRMARKLRSKKGSAIYAQRKAIVEPVNGQIKEACSLRRFLLRALEKVNGEWHLIAATHNLLRLVRFQRSQQQALAAAMG